MKLDLFTYSNKGARELNEDSYGVINTDTCYISVLCDGLGGHNCGEIASQTTVKSLVASLSKEKEINDQSLQNALRQANKRLLELQVSNPEQKGMRTTAVGCVLDKNLLHYFNCGDSRFYYFSNGALRAASKDHSYPQLSVDMGTMTFDEIRFNPDRNKLLRALGESDDSVVGTIYPPIECKPGDAFLLCSDGFWEYVLEEEMEIDLSKSQTAEQWCKFMLVRLLLKFSDANDNFSVVAGIIG